MLENDNKKNRVQLIDLIGRRANKTPNFALLVGAGASASCGIKTATQMIAEWQKELYEQSGTVESFEDWKQKQDWYEDDEEYSSLFERVYHERSQRRIYIEECVKDAKPSWGYIYLANIIRNNYFNVVLTPNFDDLLAEGCFTYADLQPKVCAHDSAAVDLTLTSARPKIIKLHGDFLYDSIKSTIRETESIDKNMRNKFMFFAREYGLVVVGYGGNDRSIMDILESMLRSEDYFPHGLYWCLRKKDKVSKKLRRLMRQQRAYWVEIETFDAFMAQLHEGLQLELPDAVRDPYRATTVRLNNFIPKEEPENEIINKHIRELERQIRKFEQAISGKFDSLVPYSFLGDTEFRHNRFERALTYYGKALIQIPHNIDLIENMGWCCLFIGQFEKCLEWSERIIKEAPDNYMGYDLKGAALTYLGRLEEAINTYDVALEKVSKDIRPQALTERAYAHLTAGNWEKVVSDTEKALQLIPRGDDKKIRNMIHMNKINQCIALKKLDRLEEMTEIIEGLLPEIDDDYFSSGAYALLRDKPNMLKKLKMALKQGRLVNIDAEFAPVFEDYRRDPDFQNVMIKAAGHRYQVINPRTGVKVDIRQVK